MSVLIGDYVTTPEDTFEVMNDGFGVLYFKRVGVRQGIFTGGIFTKFETELSRIPTRLFSIKGEIADYAIFPTDVPNLKVVENVTPSIQKQTAELFETCFPMRIARMMKLQHLRATERDATWEELTQMQDAFLQIWEDYRK